MSKNPRPRRFTAIAIALLTLAGLLPWRAAAGTISYHPITGDEDCEITNTTVYTHAVDFGNDAPRALVNGVQFQTCNSSTFGAAAGTAATIGTGTTSIQSGHTGDGGADPYLNGGAYCAMEDLVEDMNYNDATGVITLTGLSPGQPYRFRLYNRQWGSGAGTGRGQEIGFETDGLGSDISGSENTAAFEADDAREPDPSFPTFSQVYALTYDYVLSPGVSNLTVYINRKTGDSGTYHMYGLTNEEAGPDTNAPSITVFHPADDATGVYPGAELVATFDEAIALSGTGTVSIRNLDAATQADINLPNIQVDVSDSDLVIHPSAALGHGTNYAVQISSNAIVDLATNAFAGVADDVTWNFTTAALDLSAPVITGTGPADDTNQVPPDALLVATFNEDLVAGTGNITIYDVTDATNLMVIPVTNAAQVSVSSNVLTITPSVLLPGAKELAVQIDAGAVQNFSDVAFAGISDTTTWSFTTGDTTTYTGPNSNGRSDTWNKPGNWDLGVPTGALNAVIPPGVTVTADDGSLPTYTGNLLIGTGAIVRVEWLGGDTDLYRALGTTGQTVIAAQEGALINCRAGTSGTPVPEIKLEGDLTIVLSQSTQGSVDLDFDHGISGPHTIILQGKGGSEARLTASNSFAALLGNQQANGADGFSIQADAAGSLGGDVTIAASSDGDKSANLYINVADAMADTAALALNGAAVGTLITMNADDAVNVLEINGFPYPTGTYARVGTSATVDVEVAWIAGNGVLTVLSGPGDAIDPTTIAFSDDAVNGELFLALKSNVTFTLSFNEPITSSATTTDFENASSAPLQIDSVTQTSDTNVQVSVTAGGLGDIRLRVKSSAVFEDLFGNPVSVPVTSPTTVTLRELDLTTELGILDLTQNDGVNPATGNLWQEGDQYRFVFTTSTGITATATNIAVYNSFVQGLADASPLGIGAAEGVTWKAIASTATITARNNASLSNTGRWVSVWLVDGTTVVADDYVDLFGFRTMNSAINKSESGGAPLYAGTYNDVWTGSLTDGSINSGFELGAAGGTSRGGLVTKGDRHWITRFTIAQTEERPLYGISPVLTLTGPPPPAGTILILH